MALQVDPAVALDEYNSNGQDGLDDLLAILDADQVCRPLAFVQRHTLQVMGFSPE